MTLGAVPALKLPTVRTAGSPGGASRLTSVFSAVTMCAATTTGSTVVCGRAAWPPPPSSAGWNISLTRPASSPRRPSSARAAPSSMAVCESWPDACIAPGLVEAYSAEDSSRMGRASMSALSRTVRPGRPESISPMTPVPPTPDRSGMPSSRRRDSTRAAVSCSGKAISRARWVARRAAPTGPAMACAESSRVGMALLPQVPAGIGAEGRVRLVADRPARPSPARRVGDDAAHLGLVVDRVLLVAGAEVEDAASPPPEAAAAPQHLAAGERADEDQLLRRGDVEVLAIHLLPGDREDLGHALRDGVPRRHRPDQLAQAVVPPAQGARGAHEDPEHLAVVRRVQRDQAHAAADPRADPVDHLVGHLVVRRVAPPRQHVGGVEHLGRQPLAGLVQRRRSHVGLVAEVLAYAGRDRLVHAVGIDGRHRRIAALVDGLAPDRDSHDVMVAVG